MRWGKTGVHEELSEDLREENVNKIDFETCKQAYQDNIDLVENIMFNNNKMRAFMRKKINSTRLLSR